MLRALPLLAALGLAALALAPARPALADGEYAALVRDILIARQCGLADEIVEAGFRLQATALIETAVVTPSGAAQARDQGEAEYRQAWRDHGGGAVDPHCRKDGADVAARFRAYIMDE
jgi:hypothetical protein